MGRPAKTVSTLSGTVTKAEAAMRQDIETELRGRSDKIAPPEWFTPEQHKIFAHIVAELTTVGLLSNLDIYTLINFTVAAERIFFFEQLINAGIQGGAYDKAHIAARNAYVKDFYRGINELALSPQARAKIGSIYRSRVDDEKDPLQKLLAGKR